MKVDNNTINAIDITIENCNCKQLIKGKHAHKIHVVIGVNV